MTGCQHCPQWNVPGRQSFAQGHDVRRDLPMVDCKVRSGTAQSCHYLVNDEQNTVFSAYLPDSLPIGLTGNSCPQGRADYGLGDKSHDVVGAMQEDRLLQLIGTVTHAFFGRAWSRSKAAFAPVLVIGIDMRRRSQQWNVGLAPRWMPRQRQGTESASVIAMPARQAQLPIVLTFLHEIATSHLDGRLDRLGAARRKVNSRPSPEMLRRKIYQLLC